MSSHQILQHYENYWRMINDGFSSVDQNQLIKACETIQHQYQIGQTVFVCGNGGSAAIADHFHCDHLKGCSTGTTLFPRVVSLVSATPLLTAIGNDLGYDQVFSYPLERLAKPYDCLVAISSSGNSPNIIKALEMAKKKCVFSIAMVGFDGGKAAEMADIVLHVKQHNYGVVEDVHQSIAHIIAQHIRLSHINTPNVDKSKIVL